VAYRKVGVVMRFSFPRMGVPLARRANVWLVGGWESAQADLAASADASSRDLCSFIFNQDRCSGRRPVAAILIAECLGEGYPGLIVKLHLYYVIIRDGLKTCRMEAAAQAAQD